MNKFLVLLLAAQFLSAFADNTLLFAVIAMVMQEADKPDWYVPALQSVFLVAFVVLASWAGNIANKYSKSRILVIANFIKATGAGLMLLQVEPLLGYGIVGLGAAMYGPAKYGILPEMVKHNELVKANGWIEGSTILAILAGMLAGAKLADQSITWALSCAVMLLLISAGFAVALPKRLVNSIPIPAISFLTFYKETWHFLAKPHTRFAVLGGCLFWGAAACVRVILVAWAPAVLNLNSASGIAELTLFLALGIIAGSAVVPRLIPLEHLHRTLLPACMMGLLMTGLGFTHSVWSAQAVLFLLGTAGGMFIVPINAALQEMGQHSVGSGSAVAMQNFFQNLAMLSTVGIYTLAASLHVQPVAALVSLGIILIGLALLLMRGVPDALPD